MATFETVQDRPLLLPLITYSRMPMPILAVIRGEDGMDDGEEGVGQTSPQWAPFILRRAWKWYREQEARPSSILNSANTLSATPMWESNTIITWLTSDRYSSFSLTAMIDDPLVAISV